MRSKPVTILTYVTLGLLLLALGASIFMGRRENGKVRCTGIIISITDSCDNHFVDAPKLRSIIAKEYGGTLNRPLDSIRLHSIEKILTNEKYIKEAVAWKTADGKLHVKVRQRTPVARIMRQGRILYMDADGITQPMSTDWAEGVVDIVGEVPVEDGKWMNNMAAVISWLQGKGQWKDRIDRIVCDSKGEVSLYLKGRPESFVLGKPSKGRIKDRMDRIKTYEKEIAPASQKEYKSVSVKYNGQIICK